MLRQRSVVWLLAVLSFGCDGSSGIDAGARDAAAPDSGRTIDGGADAGAREDGGPVDAGGDDAGSDAGLATALEADLARFEAAVSSARTAADLATARSTWRELWRAAIRVRYVLELAAPTEFAALFEPIGSVNTAPGGVHGVEMALFGRTPDLSGAQDALDALIVDLTALRAAPPAIGDEIAAQAAVAALRSPVDRYAEIETPLAGSDLAALPELLDAVRDQLQERALLDTDLSAALTSLETALPTEIAELPAFIAASASAVDAVIDAAGARGITLPPEPSSLEIPRTFGRNFEGTGDPNRVALGRSLFFDPVLSAGDDRACSSCHRASAGYDDDLPVALGLSGASLRRNTPSTLLASMQYGSGWDLGDADVRDHALAALADPEQMGNSGTDFVADLSSIPEYGALFDRSFVDGVTAANTASALAAFIASSPPVDSPVDRFLAGDATALSADERQGLSLFLGRARCVGCHRAPLFGGTAPPAFDTTEMRVIGTPSDPSGTTLDDDLGGGERAFRVPILRNLSSTAPYMHHGVYGTLEEVIRFYDGGAGPGLGFDLPNADPRLLVLGLTAGERAQLALFLRALDDAATPRPMAPPTVPSGHPVGGRGF